MLLNTVLTFTDRTAVEKPFFRVFRRDICSINCASVCMLVEALNVYLIKHRPIEGAHCCAAGVVRALFGVRFAGVVLLNRTHTHTLSDDRINLVITGAATAFAKQFAAASLTASGEDTFQCSVTMLQ